MVKIKMFYTDLLNSVTYGDQVYEDVMSEVQYLTVRCGDLASRGKVYVS